MQDFRSYPRSNGCHVANQKNKEDDKKYHIVNPPRSHYSTSLKYSQKNHMGVPRPAAHKNATNNMHQQLPPAPALCKQLKQLPDDTSPILLCHPDAHESPWTPPQQNPQQHKHRHGARKPTVAKTPVNIVHAFFSSFVVPSL